MGCTANKESITNRDIDAMQRKEKQESQRIPRVLLLGTGDSGKTTLRKQLQNEYGNKYKSEEARKALAGLIISNLFEGAIQFAKDYLQDTSSVHAELALLQPQLMDLKTESIDSKSAEALNAITFKLPGARAELCKRNNSNLQDCFYVFLEEFEAGYPENWGGPKWVPSETDCVRCRIRTTGVVQETVNLNGSTILMIDVGGQRAERKKWIHSFEDVNTAIFVTSLSEYDHSLFEDQEKNRLLEAIELFEDVVNSRWLQHSSMMLFLNKRDLFEEKFLVRKIPLNASGLFPTAPKDNENIEQAIDWIKSMFQERNKRKDAESLIVHVTTAVDSSNVKLVFNACKQHILRSTLQASFGF